MKVRVLVVDDSRFFRRRVEEILAADPAIEVIGSAGDGAEALALVPRLKPDVITMDIEMPVMDGITAVKRIMTTHPTPILMFSSLTSEGAQATLDALEAGAVDFLPKRFEDISQDREEAKQLLCRRVRALARRGVPVQARVPAASAPVRARLVTPAPPAARTAGRRPIQLVAIGTSTGGPLALAEVLTKLPADFPAPIALIQHMPATFTPAFAQRLNQQCAITVKEAADGDRLLPGTALLAPGGRQMTVESHAGTPRVRVRDSEPGQSYKPSVDVTLSSIARIYPAETLAIILTGMGADGREGARLLKQGGSTVWAQDEASCVVYGMPAAVTEAGLSDQVLSLGEVGPQLAHQFVQRLAQRV